MNSPGGGATQGIVELLKGLPPRQYGAYVVMPSQPDVRRQETFLQLAQAMQVVPMSWWNRNYGRPAWWRFRAWVGARVRTVFHLRSILSLARLIRKWEIDLVYTTTAVTIDGALAARLCRVPHIWHIKEHIGRDGRVRFGLPDAALTRLFLTLSDRVLVMSRFIGEIFEAQRRGDAVTVVRDGVDVNAFDGARLGEAVRERLGVPAGEVLVGMAAGTASTWKRHMLFIEMAARVARGLPGVRFAVFGPEPAVPRNGTYRHAWEYAESLKERVRQLGLDNRFTWAGFHHDIPEMMGAIDILVHPCEIEPFGRVAIEAMAAGRPVVGPDRGGIAETVVDGETGLLVAAGDVDAFAQATEQLVTNPDLRRRLGSSGRERARTCFSIGQHVDHIARIYEEVLGATEDSGRSRARRSRRSSTTLRPE